MNKYASLSFPIIIVSVCSLCLTSCFEFDLDLAGFSGFGGGYGNFGVYNPGLPINLTIDSVLSTQSDELTLAITITCELDSTIVLNQTDIFFQEYNSNINRDRTFPTGPDTVTLSANKPFSFIIEIDSLEANTTYEFYASRHFANEQWNDYVTNSWESFYATTKE